MFWLDKVLGMTSLFALISFTADLLTIVSFVRKEVSMVAMLITGAVGFVQELQVSDRMNRKYRGLSIET